MTDETTQESTAPAARVDPVQLLAARVTELEKVVHILTTNNPDLDIAGWRQGCTQNWGEKG